MIFGPWIKFSDYVELTTSASQRRWSFRWLVSLATSLAMSFVALFASVCVASVLLTQWDAPTEVPAVVVSWFAAYRDAFSFRHSHYYVSFTSRATLIAMGAGMTDKEIHGMEDDSKSSKNAKATRPSNLSPKKSSTLLEIANPLHVEIPRSLVEVVVHWNVPMHRWLKNYVFRPVHPTLGTPLAILTTYAISALLHGLNFQLAAVLFSLGLFSYVEHVLRAKLGRIFDACVLSRACSPSCQHGNRPTLLWVKLVNFFFGCVSVLHLAYLGVGFDNSEEQSVGYSMAHVMEKWGKLGYASHVVTVIFGLSVVVI